MRLNPFRDKTKTEIAKDTIKTATVTASPLPGRRTRRLGLALATVVVAGGTALLLRRLLGGQSDVPAPEVTPTAPGGPTLDRLNDPALKAKGESELFADENAAA